MTVFFTYNCTPWGLTEAATKKVSAFHRRQLRALIGVRWPHRISNEARYRTTGSRRFEEYAEEARMRMVGHVLRMDRAAPAQVAADLYFSAGRRRRGRPHARLASSIAKDLRKAGLRFAKARDLADLREIASDRKKWRQIARTLTY